MMTLLCLPSRWQSSILSLGISQPTLASSYDSRLVNLSFNLRTSSSILLLDCISVWSDTTIFISFLTVCLVILQNKLPYFTIQVTSSQLQGCKLRDLRIIFSVRLFFKMKHHFSYSNGTKDAKISVTVKSWPYAQRIFIASRDDNTLFSKSISHDRKAAHVNLWFKLEKKTFLSSWLFVAVTFWLPIQSNKIMLNRNNSKSIKNKSHKKLYKNRNAHNQGYKFYLLTHTQTF